MEKEKSYKVLIGVLIVIIILLCAVIYLLFGKSINLKDNGNKSATPTTTDTDSRVITDISKWPNKNDNSVLYDININSLLTTKEISTNFNNLVKETNDLKISYTCTLYHNGGEAVAIYKSPCYLFKANINNMISIDDLTTAANDEANIIARIFKTNNYYIILKDGVDLEISIYDLNWKELFYEPNRIDKVEPFINKNILYFTTVDRTHIYYEYIDLSNSSLKKVQLKVEDWPQKQSNDKYEAHIKTGECQNLLSTGKTTGNVLFTTDLGVDIKHVAKASWGDIYIGNKLLWSDYALTRACIYNKYIVLGIGEGSLEVFGIYNNKGEKIIDNNLPDYEINNNIITSYEVDYNNKNMTKITIDLSGDTPKITKGTKENYTCSEDSSPVNCPIQGNTLKDKIIKSDCCS